MIRLQPDHKTLTRLAAKRTTNGAHSDVAKTADSRLFELVKTFEHRADLVRRTEIKFAMPRADVAKLRQAISTRCRAVIHNEQVSTVRSVYFDDIHLSACQANLSGLGNRQKLRLRWYDSLRPQFSLFPEIKWRKNRVTGKHRAEVRCTQSIGDLTWRELIRDLPQCLPEVFVQSFERFPEPTVLVEYQREHFVSQDANLRFTIDYAIKGYEQAGRRCLNTSFGSPLHDVVVVEAKVPVGQEQEIQALLFPFAARANRCSKYVHCCELTGLLRHL